MAPPYIKSLSPKAETVVSNDPKPMSIHTTIDLVVMLGMFPSIERIWVAWSYVSPLFRLNQADLH